MTREPTTMAVAGSIVTVGTGTLTDYPTSWTTRNATAPRALTLSDGVHRLQSLVMKLGFVHFILSSIASGVLHPQFTLHLELLAMFLVADMQYESVSDGLAVFIEFCIFGKFLQGMNVLFYGSSPLPLPPSPPAAVDNR